MVAQLPVVDLGALLLTADPEECVEGEGASPPARADVQRSEGIGACEKAGAKIDAGCLIKHPMVFDSALWERLVGRAGWGSCVRMLGRCHLRNS